MLQLIWDNKYYYDDIIIIENWEDSSFLTIPVWFKDLYSKLVYSVTIKFEKQQFETSCIHGMI